MSFVMHIIFYALPFILFSSSPALSAACITSYFLKIPFYVHFICEVCEIPLERKMIFCYCLHKMHQQQWHIIIASNKESYFRNSKKQKHILLTKTQGWQIWGLIKKILLHQENKPFLFPYFMLFVVILYVPLFKNISWDAVNKWQVMSLAVTILLVSVSKYSSLRKCDLEAIKQILYNIVYFLCIVTSSILKGRFTEKWKLLEMKRVVYLCC